MEREVRNWHRRVWWLQRVDLVFGAVFVELLLAMAWQIEVTGSGTRMILGLGVLYGLFALNQPRFISKWMDVQRKRAAPHITSTADLETLQWLYPASEPAPAAFWQRVMQFPARDARWDRREEFASRIERALCEGSAPEELLFRVVRWQETAQPTPIGQVRSAVMGLRKAFSEPFRARFDAEIVWRVREI